MKKIFTFFCIFLSFLTPVLVFAEGTVFSQGFPIKKNDTGIETVIIQRRLYDLGYVHFRPTGKYADMTVSGVKNFQSRNGLPVTGEVTYDTYMKLFTADVRRHGSNAAIPRIFGKGQIVSTKSGELFDWKKIVSEAFPVGATATVTDYNTGLSYTVQRTGGTNHADVQTVDSASYNNLLTSFGGGVSWEKRAVIVEVGGMRIAGSIFGYPNHSSAPENSSSENSYCLYFSGSKSDIGAGIPDAEHDAKCLVANGQ